VILEFGNGFVKRWREMWEFFGEECGEFIFFEGKWAVKKL
jgi:hypothetical protein